MTNPRRLHTLEATYISTVVVLGALAFVDATGRMLTAPVDSQWFILVALTLLAGSFTIPMSPLPVRVSVSETFVFAAVLLFGTTAGTVTVVIESLVTSFWARPHRHSLLRVLFNPAAAALAIWISGNIFYWLSGIAPYIERSTPLLQVFGPLILFATLYFLLNSWLVAFAIALTRDETPFRVWWPQFAWIAVNYLSGASVAAIIVTYRQRIDASTLLIIVPLLGISYLTFKIAMGRLNDSTRHLSMMNRLYLSTIETLAMAIDAKDQITHGHIRRVQTFAIALAEHVGISDNNLIRAIEAAALLHDMGKLAVPEHILNKPGKLTTAEFDRIKLHASVGADILSAIDFPYPVVPIVRHHHENWDGSGYPDGLRGTAIPIGARILSVVDCFDALTSDRPYRQKVSADEAMGILLERRGTMYDPLIVDTFVRVHDRIGSGQQTAGPPKHALNEITSSTSAVSHNDSPPALQQITQSGEEMLALYQLAGAGQLGASETFGLIAKHLERLIPSSIGVLFVYDPETDDLEAAHVIGESASILRGMRIKLGQKLSGWVGANRQPIVNSDPLLDLGELVHALRPGLQSCLSSPLVSDGRLVGVITLYSEVPNGFTHEHRRIIEIVTRQTAARFERAIQFDKSMTRDRLTGLPSHLELEHLAGASDREDLFREVPCALINIRVQELERLKVDYGDAATDSVLRHIVHCVRSNLRAGDVLFRHGDDGFFALLAGTDLQVAQSVADRVALAVHEPPLRVESGSITVRVSVDVAGTSEATSSLRELLVSNTRRLRRDPAGFPLADVH